CLHLRPPACVDRHRPRLAVDAVHDVDHARRAAEPAFRHHRGRRRRRRDLVLGALLGSIYIVQAFDAIDVMTGGGPGSTNVPYFVYQESIGGGFRYGSASAYAIVVVVFAIIIATFALRLLSGLLKDEERA